jgi:hypothetical protein
MAPYRQSAKVDTRPLAESRSSLSRDLTDSNHVLPLALGTAPLLRKRLITLSGAHHASVIRCSVSSGNKSLTEEVSL